MKVKEMDRKQYNQYCTCKNRFYRYKKLPDYYRMRISDTDFFTDEDLIYLNNLKENGNKQSI